MRMIEFQEKERLVRDIRRLNKELAETNERCNTLEVFSTRSIALLLCHCVIVIAATSPNSTCCITVF